MLITHLHRKRSGHWIDSAPGIIGLGVAIILFEGGKDLKLGEFRRVGHGVGRLNKESASLC